MASQSFISTADFGVNLGLNDNLTPALIAVGNEIRKTESYLKSAFDEKQVIEYQQELIRLKDQWNQLGGAAVQASLQQAKAAQQAADAENKLADSLNNVTTNSFQNFRAIGQADRITREFASGGLNQGLNGLSMFGNSLTRLATQEGGFRNAIAGLATAFTGPAGIVLGVSAAIGIFEQWEKSQKKAQEEAAKFGKALDDARIKGTEQGLKLQELISIADDATLSDKKRKEALDAVKKSIGEVNSELAAQIHTTDDAKKAVDQLTQAYIQQAVISARTAKIAADQVALENAQTTIAKAKPGDIGKVLAAQATQQLGGTAGLGAGLLIKALGLQDLADAIDESKRLKTDLDTQVTALQTDIKNLSKNPFGVGLVTGQEGSKGKKNDARGWGEDMINMFKDLNAYIRDYNSMKHPWENESLNRRATIQEFQIGKGPDTEKTKLSKELPDWMNEYTTAVNKNDAAVKKQYQDYKDFSNLLSKTLTKDVMGLWDAMQKGENIGQAIGDMFSKLAEQIAAAALQAALFAVILDAVSGGTSGAASASFGDIFGGLLGLPIGKHAEGGITTGPSFGLIGEAGPEAIMPLSKLGNVMNNSFNAGAMTGGGSSMNNNGQFILRGSDLVLALQRSNYSLNLRRGS